MPWYVWGQLGLGCLVVELLMPGGYFLFLFGLCCLVVALLSGLGPLDSLWLQLTVLVLLAGVSLALVRPLLVRRAARRSQKR